MRNRIVTREAGETTKIPHVPYIYKHVQRVTNKTWGIPYIMTPTTTTTATKSASPQRNCAVYCVAPPSNSGLRDAVWKEGEGVRGFLWSHAPWTPYPALRVRGRPFRRQRFRCSPVRGAVRSDREGNGSVAALPFRAVVGCNGVAVSKYVTK